MTLTPVRPAAVDALMARLWAAGHAAYIVGGSIRDALLGREPNDWDLATDARPELLQALFPGAVYENRFGTVVVREGGEAFEITTFRTEREYVDHRRPTEVEFGTSIEEDLERRDFTVNAIAWGARPGESPRVVDPHGGAADLEARVLRAVGDPSQRFREDALRIVRGLRLSATLAFEIEAQTLAAMRAEAALVRHLSGERVWAELEALLAAPQPSVGLATMADVGALAHLLPELEAERGIPQDKIPGDDLWRHTLRAVDAAPADRPLVRLAALLHDVGKPATMADGHFHGHEALGGQMTAAILKRLRAPRAIADRVVLLVAQHMFTYDDGWSDAGVRRFIKRVGRPALDELFALREADNVGSGHAPDAHRLGELRSRVAAELAASVALDRNDLAIDGDDLIRELGLAPGPRLGRLIDDLLERVIADPKLNDRPTLLAIAAAALADEGAS
jgi:putative nucleotidyltransferase with HDIG domain